MGFGAVAVVAAGLAFSASGQTYSVLKSFTGLDGANPGATMILSGNTLYGTTYAGGSSNFGTVFKVRANGTGYTVLQSFLSATGPDGASSRADLVLSGSTLYGTTYAGGSSAVGTVFKLNTNGTGFTTILSIGFDTSRFPLAGLVLSGATLYGVTYGGPITPPRYGTLFKVNTNGTGYVKMLDFTPFSQTDPQRPWAGLMLSGSTLYGTTYTGGVFSAGTVFKFNTNGTGFSVLTNFTGANGAKPRSTLLLSGSTLYGTTEQGGASNLGTVFKLNTNGTGFSVLKQFVGSDGATPIASLALVGSTLYGTTYAGGNSNVGTVFTVNTNGSDFATLKHFGGTDGQGPAGGLVILGSMLYGTTYSGGDQGNGVVFAINLSPSISATSFPGGPGLTWPAIEGLTYQVQYKTNLTQNNWSNLDSSITATGAMVTVPTPLGSNAQRFFRVFVPQ